MIAYAYVAHEKRTEIIEGMGKFFARWNEALGNPWQDLAFKPKGKNGGALICRAHLIGQTEWSVAALIQAVLVSGNRRPQVRWANHEPSLRGAEL